MNQVQYQVKISSYYWNKYFKEKTLFATLYTAMITTLLFTNIVGYAKVGVGLIVLMGIVITYIFLHRPYKKFIALLSNNFRVVKVNVYRDSTYLNGRRLRFYAIEFCDNKQINETEKKLFPCEYAFIPSNYGENVECLLFDKENSEYFVLMSADEKFMVLVLK